MTKVNCSVHSCEFWGEGNICMAEAISVKNNLEADMDDDLYNIEYAEELGVDMEPDDEAIFSADSSSKTCCETMRPKDRDRGMDDNFFDHGPGCR